MNQQTHSSSTDGQPSEAFDIAVVGGGLVGATLSLLLADTRQDWRIALIEAQAYDPGEETAIASFDARSTALSPSSVAVFEDLRCWPAMSAHATAIESIRVSDRGHFGKLTLTRADNQGRALGQVVENKGLGKALMSAVQTREQIHVVAPAEVTKVQPQREGMTLVIEGRAPLRARLVVIADGAESPLRRKLGIAERVKDYHQSAVVANVRHTHPHVGVAHERFTRQGPLALLPLGGAKGRHSALVWTWPSHDNEQAVTASDASFLQQLQASFGYSLGAFEQVSTRHAYPLRLITAQEQVRSGLVLLGNAAHALHPVAGQGFNLALRDACRLAETLAPVALEQLGDLAKLEEYHRRQQRDQARTIGLSDSFIHIFGRGDPLVVAARNIGLRALDTLPWVRHLFIQQLAGRAEPHPRVKSWPAGAD